MEIITINNEKALSENGFGCLKNVKHVGYKPKSEWLIKNFKNGLVINLIPSEKKSINMIEYIPVENCWRGVKGKDFLFIHCIWVYPKTENKKGHASALINECINNARAQNKKGVCVITSSGSFMVDKHVFLKNGFEEIQQLGKYSLLCYTFDNVSKQKLPVFTDTEKNLNEFKESGLTLIYSGQCPMFHKSVIDLSKTAEEYEITMEIIELDTPEQAQNTVSIHGTFSLVYKGGVLADHYISKTRFKNILKSMELI